MVRGPFFETEISFFKLRQVVPSATASFCWSSGFWAQGSGLDAIPPYARHIEFDDYGSGLGLRIQNGLKSGFVFLHKSESV